MNRIRIVGGEWRSRLLEVADVPGLRPTPDRVRETLFNWLGQRLDGQSCLDLFAGSGVLGFEAASRGASLVTLVERDPKALAALARNAQMLNAGQIRIQRADALEFLRTETRHYDLIFLDPPYRQGWLDRVAESLPGLLAPGGLVYVEAEQAVESLGPWQCIRHGRAGQVRYHLLAQAET